jgi:hypothetical protein
MYSPICSYCSHESIDIGTRKFGESTIFEDEPGDIMCLGDLLEDIDIDRISCFIFLRRLDPKCLEKKYLKLFRRRDIDGSDELMDLRLYTADI